MFIVKTDLLTLGRMTPKIVRFSKSLNFTLLTCFQVQGFVIVVGFVVIPYKLLFDSLKVALDLCCTNMIK